MLHLGRRAAPWTAGFLPRREGGAGCEKVRRPPPKRRINPQNRVLFAGRPGDRQFSLDSSKSQENFEGFGLRRKTDGQVAGAAGGRAWARRLFTLQACGPGPGSGRKKWGAHQGAWIRGPAHAKRTAVRRPLKTPALRRSPLRLDRPGAGRGSQARWRLVFVG